MRRAALAAALASLLAAHALAVVHTNGNGAGNTTPPADDPGFAHVGVTGNNLSGVYLGNQWVLTAYHVGEQPITLNGVSYPALPGSRVRLEHSPGVYADLALVRIVGKPSLPPLVLASAPPAVNDQVTLIGNGWNREASQVCWNASFVEIACTGSSPFRGYKRLGSQRTVRWGRNLVSQVGVNSPMGGTITRAFQTEFDNPGITHEAQAVPGDSGGAVFRKNGSQWELAGLLFTILVYEGQPYDTTAVFGTATLAADVSYYRSQILAIMNPPPQIPALPAPVWLLGAAALAGLARGALARPRSRAPQLPPQTRSQRSST